MASKKPATDPDLSAHYDLGDTIPSPFAKRYVEAKETAPSADTDPGLATAVRCDERWLIVTLSTGREVRAPLADYPRLAQATPDQRMNARIEGHGTSIHWPDVDEDIGVDHLLGISEEEHARFAGFTIHAARPSGN
jgi:hypothetical protein